jgi:16S rRNA (guanine966-N2)-methyltransferase
VLDGFAGSGALSFEAISRGAAAAVLFELDGGTAAKLRENAARLGLEDSVDVRQADFLADAPKLAGVYAFHVIFLDPPYASGLLGQALEVSEKLLSPGGIIVAEHSSQTEMPDEAGNLEKQQSRRYGAAAFTFYKMREDA